MLPKTPPPSYEPEPAETTPLSEPVLLSSVPDLPRSAPDSADSVAQEAVDTLFHLTETIHNHAGKPPSGDLAQWVFQRGRLLEEMNRVPWSELTPVVREVLLAKLQSCRAMDNPIEQDLQSTLDSLEAQLKGARDTRSLLGKYHISGGLDSPGTRDREA
jgi:hypothetical protein